MQREDGLSTLGSPIMTVAHLAAFLKALGLPPPQFVGREEIMVFGVEGEAMTVRVEHDPQDLVRSAPRKFDKREFVLKRAEDSLPD